MRKWIIIAVAGVVAIGVAVAVAIGSMAPTAHDPGAAPSPSLTARPTTSEASSKPVETKEPAPIPTEQQFGIPDGVVHPAVNPIPVAEDPHDQAMAAVMATLDQRHDETPSGRATRLAPYFTPGSPTPAANLEIDLPAMGVMNGVIEAQDIQTAEPSMRPDGRGMFLVSVGARTTGVLDNGTMYQDVSTQLWRVVLSEVNGFWSVDFAVPDDQPDPQ